jgi:hypothetical protein
MARKLVRYTISCIINKFTDYSRSEVKGKAVSEGARVEIRISGAIPHWGGGKVHILHINVTRMDSGWRLTVQEVLRICCVALWHN